MSSSLARAHRARGGEHAHPMVIVHAQFGQVIHGAL
jgi:hypothetical protein